MKLLRYGPEGSEKPGLLDVGGAIRDLSDHVADIAGETLTPEGIAHLATIDVESLPRVEGAPRIGPCVGAVGKFICVGLNYADHAAESGMEVPPEPVLFAKATSAICGPNDDVRIPRGSTKTDWEVELGVVIGKPAALRGRGRGPGPCRGLLRHQRLFRADVPESIGPASGSRASPPTPSALSARGS
jgi:2-keto-4-pentenoate hydratase/2-oxohepta-3-ene-1,7-dioic acid hydratase in catechol pathway